MLWEEKNLGIFGLDNRYYEFRKAWSGHKEVLEPEAGL